MFFCFGLQPLLLQLRRRFPTVRVAAYVDDIGLQGPVGDTAAAYQWILDNGPPLGYDLRPSKCAVVPPSAGDLRNDHHSLSIMFPGAPVQPTCKYLGASAGTITRTTADVATRAVADATAGAPTDTVADVIAGIAAHAPIRSVICIIAGPVAPDRDRGRGLLPVSGAACRSDGSGSGPGRCRRLPPSSLLPRLSGAREPRRRWWWPREVVGKLVVGSYVRVGATREASRSRRTLQANGRALLTGQRARVVLRVRVGWTSVVSMLDFAVHAHRPPAPMWAQLDAEVVCSPVAA